MGDMRAVFDDMKMGRAEYRAKIEPNRVQYATNKITSLGYAVSWNDDEKALSIYDPKVRNRAMCKLFPYTGWYSGKGMGSGRGISALITKLESLR